MPQVFAPNPEAVPKHIKGKASTAPWPRKGDLIYRVTSKGKVVRYKYDQGKKSGPEVTEARRNFLGVFRTRAEAQARLELIRKLVGFQHSVTAYASPPRYCACGPASTLPSQTLHCHREGAKLKEQLSENGHCLACGLIRLRKIRVCPEIRWWHSILGITHTVGW